MPNGEQVQRVAKLAMQRGKSVDFTGHWQRRRPGDMIWEPSSPAVAGLGLKSHDSKDQEDNCACGAGVQRVV